MVKTAAQKAKDAAQKRAKRSKLSEEEIKNESEKAKLRTKLLKIKKRKEKEAISDLVDSESTTQTRKKSSRISNPMSTVDSSFISFKYILGKGFGIFAAKTIPPVTDIANYGGTIIRSETKMQKLIDMWADKILQIKGKLLWLDGTYSKTIGPWLNHASDCVANCCIVFDANIAIIVSKGSELGNIEPGVELTFDYGIDPDQWPDDPDLD